jgi:hypothetical protein
LELKDGEDVKVFKDQILSYGNKEFIIDMLNFDFFIHNHAETIFLKIPELWKDLSLDDWKEIIVSIHRPETYRPFMEVSSHFEDVKFLYNWIEIDSISLYKDIPNLSESNKKSLDKNLKYLFDDSDKRWNLTEDFEDGTLCNPIYFNQAKMKLVSQGAKLR